MSRDSRIGESVERLKILRSNGKRFGRENLRNRSVIWRRRSQTISTAECLRPRPRTALSLSSGCTDPYGCFRQPSSDCGAEVDFLQPASARVDGQQGSSNLTTEAVTMITQIPKPLQRLISRPLLVLAMLVGILIPSLAMGAPAFASGVYQVTASPYLNVRNGPYTTNPITATLPYGSSVVVYCQYRSSSSVNGSTMWDFLGFTQSNGQQNWVSDYWINTPYYNQPSPGLPNCSGNLDPSWRFN